MICMHKLILIARENTKRSLLTKIIYFKTVSSAAIKIYSLRFYPSFFFAIAYICLPNTTKMVR